MTWFEIGDLVRVKETTTLGNYNKTPDGLSRSKTYRVASIRRGIDGAYDWDDLFLEGITRRRDDGSEYGYCEFDFEKAEQ